MRNDTVHAWGYGGGEEKWRTPLGVAAPRWVAAALEGAGHVVDLVDLLDFVYVTVFLHCPCGCERSQALQLHNPFHQRFGQQRSKGTVWKWFA